MTAWCLPQVKIILFYQKSCIQVQDLAGESFAMREQGSGTRQLFEDYAARHQISVQTALGGKQSPYHLLNAVLMTGAFCQSLPAYEIMRSSTIRSGFFYNQNGEWNRKFKLVYHKNKFLTPAIYELEKLLHTYKNIKLPTNMGILE